MKNLSFIKSSKKIYQITWIKTKMTTSISSEELEKKTESCRMKDNTVDKKSLVEKRTKWVIEHLFSDHKKLRNEEKHFIKNHKTWFTLIF